ncbi:MAG: winged helix-turn-helix domain-containing protein [Promethearchaeota archaeon]
MPTTSEPKEDPLVKYLSALRNDIRIAIIKDLSFHNIPREFNEIQRELEKSFGSTINLSYHLNILKENQMIVGDATGYQLTEVGEKSITFLESMGGLLKNDSQILIRTSKYSVELFDESIIEKNLQLEANMPAQKAKMIATEAKRRLKKAKVTYLTTPLVREYINAILIENHYEDYRAKLTRLGIPPYDVMQMLKAQIRNDPEDFKNLLGRNILEQYVLLNLLQKKYADAFLTGQFLFTNLGHFGLTPLELIISGQQLEKILTNYYLNNSNLISPHEAVESILNLDYLDVIEIYSNFIHDISRFFPHGLTVLRFDFFLENFLQHFSSRQLERFLRIRPDKGEIPWAITIGISLIVNYVELEPLITIYQADMLMSTTVNSTFSTSSTSSTVSTGSASSTSTAEAIPKSISPLPGLVLHFSKGELKQLQTEPKIENLSPFYQKIVAIMQHPFVSLDQYSKWGWPKAEHVFSNLEIPIAVEDISNLKMGIVLGKISINVLALFKQAQEDEKIFFKDLEKAIFRVFDFLEYKATLLTRNLEHFPGWQEIRKNVFGNINTFDIFQPTNTTSSNNSTITVKKSPHPENTLQTQTPNIPIIGAVSFHGLDEMILAKTNLFIRMQSANRVFAVKVLNFIQKLLDKQNLISANRIHYILSEAHPQKELSSPTHQILQSVDQIGRKLFNEPVPCYRPGFHYSPDTLPLTTVHQIYSDLSQSSFNEMTLAYELPKMEKKIRDQEILEMIQNLLGTKCCRLRFHSKF